MMSIRRNMVTADELIEQQDYEDILMDIREEVGNTSCVA